MRDGGAEVNGSVDGHRLRGRPVKMWTDVEAIDTCPTETSARVNWRRHC